MSQTVESKPENQAIVSYLRDTVLSMSGGGSIVEPDLLYKTWPEMTALVPRECHFDLYSVPVLVHPSTHVVFGVAYRCLLKIPEDVAVQYRRGWFLSSHKKGRPFAALSGWWGCSGETGNAERCLAAYRLAGA